MGDDPLLDDMPGNMNDPRGEVLVRAIHPDPPVQRDCVFFASYFDAPRIVDWLAEHHVDARFEQRRHEGVTIVMPDGRAYVGDHIVATDGWACPLQRRLEG